MNPCIRLGIFFFGGGGGMASGIFFLSYLFLNTYFHVLTSHIKYFFFFFYLTDLEGGEFLVHSSS